ncbi:type II secretion system protein GspD [Neorhodopirellula pilleata]|uniref:Putative type II secretion system protein D n=1 Tax=Neorhodopirellula pilleata TaxID=2714738 RepID=A0A5C6A4I2_9BACT|nr:secretin N-terminal domain-containing protein [Neorhodopirellula pilleata]TWT94208.1 putative type II secretion system protein D precursor [Neorhodopirellula pilleata]
MRSKQTSFYGPKLASTLFAIILIAVPRAHTPAQESVISTDNSLSPNSLSPNSLLPKPVAPEEVPPQQATLFEEVASSDAATGGNGASAVASNVWTFNFNQAPWGAVLQEFARMMDYSLTMQKEPSGQFTYYDSRYYTIQQAIDILNDHLVPQGSILVRKGDRLIVLDTQQPINDQHVPFIPVNQIESLGRSEIAGAAIPVNGMDVRLAMEEVNALISPLGQVRPMSHSGRMLVIDTGTYLKRIRDLLMETGFANSELVTHVHALHHAKADDVAKAINDFLADENNGGTTASNLITRGQPHVTPEATTNSLLVRGNYESVRMLEELIIGLDRSPREVLLQALIVEVALGDTLETGVELGFQDSVLFDRSIVDSIQTINETVTSANGVQTTNQRILSQVSSPGLNFNGPQLGNNAVRPSTIGTQSLSNFGMGRVNGDLGYGGLVLAAGSESVNVLLRALDAKFKINVLSRPQVRTVENVEAFMQVGQQVPVVDGVTVNSVGSANPVIRQDKAGIILRATPRISPDGKVQVVVETEKSAFNLARGTGVPIFTDTTNGRVIEAPVKDITTAQTTVSVQSGETIVLGGMITSSTNVVNRKVPIIGDIPYLGRLFRYDLDRCEKRELLVFLTPIVLNSQEMSDALMQEELTNSAVHCLPQNQLMRWQGIRETIVEPLGTPMEFSLIEDGQALPLSDLEVSRSQAPTSVEWGLLYQD